VLNLKDDFSFKDFSSKYKTMAYSALYWMFVFVALISIKKYILFVPVFLMSMLLYIPYRMIVFKSKNIKGNVKKSIIAMILFAGVFNLYSLTIKNHVDAIIKSPQSITYKTDSSKIVSMKNLNIYLNEKNEKIYIYYKVNGFFGKSYSEIDNLVVSDKSEYSSRFGTFHKLNSTLEIAFPTYKNELSTEYLFKVKNNKKEYIFKAFIPFENCLDLIKNAGFKQTLNINLTGNLTQSIYLNNTSKEIIICDNKVAVSSTYTEVPYDKSDYFAYRYEMFKNNSKDDSKTTSDINITLLKTYSELSTDVKRITFYSEGTDQSIMYGMGEIIFDKVAYVFRTGIINTDSILSIKRAN